MSSAASASATSATVGRVLGHYDVPSYLDIGKLYSIMIEDCAKPGEEVQELINIFQSFISDAISNFNSDLYYQNPDYLEWSYREGELLD